MNHTRHLGLFNFPPGFAITLIGAGGIGAVTALTLAKMGVPFLNIFDDDVIDETNLPGQLHKLSDLGMSKSHCLVNTICEFADDTSLSAYEERIGAEDQLPRSNMVISAVDSIDARKGIWTSVYRAAHEGTLSHYLDSRMAGEQYQHFAVDMHSVRDVERYNIELSSLNESDVEELPCTEKATMFTAMMAAGHIATVVRNVLRNNFTSHRLVHYIPEEVVHKFNL